MWIDPAQDRVQSASSAVLEALQFKSNGNETLFALHYKDVYRNGMDYLVFSHTFYIDSPLTNNWTVTKFLA